MPQSLAGRLIAIATVSTLAALLFAGLAIGQVLERFVMAGLDQRLDAQVRVLARAVRPDGRIDRTRAIDLPPFDEAGSGWTWRIDGPGGPAMLPHPGPPRLADGPHGRRHPRSGDVRGGRGGGGLHVRQLTIATRGGPVTITAAAPRAVATRPLRDAMLPLLGSLALLGLALAGATLVQLRLGLRPLRTLSAALADVRSGRRRTVPDDQPDELRPLVIELNGLIDQNAAGLEQARRHVANLAHGLKTPLAALAVRLAEPGRDPDATLRQMVERIDTQIRHHLGRARASAPGAAIRARTRLAEPVDDLFAVLRRVHADRAIAADAAMTPDLAVAVDAQDVAEMLGNLLDNGWRHARAAVRVAAVRDGALVRIAVEDDGAGLSAAAAADALVPGRRLDERGDGHGFGLSITRELAELNGGSLTLGRGDRLGGLRAVLILPAPVDDGSTSDR